MRKLSFIFLSSILYARALVPKVEPIIHNGIQYKTSHVAYIDAINIKSGRSLWRRQIYVVKYKPNLPHCAQEKFIRKMKIKDNILIINDKYYLNLETLEVISLSGKFFEEKFK